SCSPAATATRRASRRPSPDSGAPPGFDIALPPSQSRAGSTEGEFTMQAQILAPAAVLAAWTLVMLVWVAATRLPALKQIGGMANAKPGGRGQDLEGVIDDRINWKSHNY